MYDVPNLYSFATKELAQDATLAYILAWAKPVYRESHPRLHRLGTDMLRALLATKERRGQRSDRHISRCQNTELTALMCWR